MLCVAVNMTMIYSYYEAGTMIVEKEQGGKEMLKDMFSIEKSIDSGQGIVNADI